MMIPCLPLHESVYELVHKTVAAHEKNALVFVRLMRDRHVLRVRYRESNGIGIP